MKLLVDELISYGNESQTLKGYEINGYQASQYINVRDATSFVNFGYKFNIILSKPGDVGGNWRVLKPDWL